MALGVGLEKRRTLAAFDRERIEKVLSMLVAMGMRRCSILDDMQWDLALRIMYVLQGFLFSEFHVPSCRSMNSCDEISLCDDIQCQSWIFQWFQ